MIIGCTFLQINTAQHCISGSQITSRAGCDSIDGRVEGFTKRYHLKRLVWIEHFRNMNDAIACEKKLKGWRRGRKIALIKQTNPRWLDLSEDWEQDSKFYDRPWNMSEMI